MLTHWEHIGEFEVTKQRLADQARQIRINGWLSDLDLEEIKRKTKPEVLHLVNLKLKQCIMSS